MFFLCENMFETYSAIVQMIEIFYLFKIAKVIEVAKNPAASYKQHHIHHEMNVIFVKSLGYFMLILVASLYLCTSYSLCFNFHLIIIRDPILIIYVPHNPIAQLGVRPSAGTQLTTNLNILLSKFL